MARCVLDTGCTKSITDKKRQNKLSDEDSIRYQTYGSIFKSPMTASVGFKMMEFEIQKNNTSEYKFQIDEISDPTKELYNMIIESALLWNMGVNTLFKENNSVEC